MKITCFAKKVAKLEGKKESISIAQILEVIKIINGLVGGELYKIIRKMK